MDCVQISLFVYIIGVLVTIITIFSYGTQHHTVVHKDKTIDVNGIIIANCTTCYYPFQNQVLSCYNFTASPVETNAVCSLTVNAVTGSCTIFNEYQTNQQNISDANIGIAMGTIGAFNFVLYWLFIYHKIQQHRNRQLLINDECNTA